MLPGRTRRLCEALNDVSGLSAFKKPQPTSRTRLYCSLKTDIIWRWTKMMMLYISKSQVQTILSPEWEAMKTIIAASVYLLRVAYMGSYRNWGFQTVVREKNLESPWTARRSNQSILREINPEYSLEGLMLKQKLQWKANSLEKQNKTKQNLILGKIEGTEHKMVGWHH